SRLQLGSIWEHHEDALENTPFYASEVIKRALAKNLADAFAKIADALTAQQQAHHADLPLCPLDEGFSVYLATRPGESLPIALCQPASQTQGVQSLDNLTNGGTNISPLPFRGPASFDPLAPVQLEMLLGGLFQARVATAALEASQRQYELLDTLQ